MGRYHPSLVSGYWDYLEEDIRRLFWRNKLRETLTDREVNPIPTVYLSFMQRNLKLNVM